MSEERKALLVALALVVLFAAGASWLLAQRLRRGDVYPSYSSLRSDPLGTKALREAIDELPDVSARPYYRFELPDERDTTLFVLGFRPRRLLPEMALESVAEFAGLGGRVVIALHPGSSVFLSDDSEETEGDDAEGGEAAEDNPEAGGDDADDEGNQEEECETGTCPLPGVQVEAVMRGDWGLRFKRGDLGRDEGERLGVTARLLGDRPDLPGAVPWHSPILLECEDEAWTPAYECAGEPVVAERRWGAGTIVVATDSYLFSNEAMLNDRQPELLAWLVGGSSDVVFSEIHLGVAEQRGIMTLAREYRLHGLLGGLLVLACLYVWSCAASLVPPPGDDDDVLPGDSGHDATAGLVNLLRRSVPRQALLAACVSEWRESIAFTGRIPKEKLDRIEMIVAEERARPAKERDPVASYNRIATLLNAREL